MYIQTGDDSSAIIKPSGIAQVATISKPTDENDKSLLFSPRSSATSVTYYLKVSGIDYYATYTDEEDTSSSIVPDIYKDNLPGTVYNGSGIYPVPGNSNLYYNHVVYGSWTRNELPSESMFKNFLKRATTDGNGTTNGSIIGQTNTKKSCAINITESKYLSTTIKSSKSESNTKTNGVKLGVDNATKNNAIGIGNGDSREAPLYISNDSIALFVPINSGTLNIDGNGSCFFINSFELHTILSGTVTLYMRYIFPPFCSPINPDEAGYIQKNATYLKATVKCLENDGKSFNFIQPIRVYIATDGFDAAGTLSADGMIYIKNTTIYQSFSDTAFSGCNIPKEISLDDFISKYEKSEYYDDNKGISFVYI